MYDSRYCTSKKATYTVGTVVKSLGRERTTRLGTGRVVATAGQKEGLRSCLPGKKCGAISVPFRQSNGSVLVLLFCTCS